MAIDYFPMYFVEKHLLAQFRLLGLDFFNLAFGNHYLLYDVVKLLDILYFYLVVVSISATFNFIFVADSGSRAAMSFVTLAGVSFALFDVTVICNFSA